MLARFLLHLSYIEPSRTEQLKFNLIFFANVIMWQGKHIYLNTHEAYLFLLIFDVHFIFRCFVKFAVRDHEPEATDTNDFSINVNSKFFVGRTSTWACFCQVSVVWFLCNSLFINPKYMNNRPFSIRRGLLILYIKG